MLRSYLSRTLKLSPRPLRIVLNLRQDSTLTTSAMRDPYRPATRVAVEKQDVWYPTFQIRHPDQRH